MLDHPARHTFTTAPAPLRHRPVFILLDFTWGRIPFPPFPFPLSSLHSLLSPLAWAPPGRGKGGHVTPLDFDIKFFPYHYRCT